MSFITNPPQTILPTIGLIEDWTPSIVNFIDPIRTIIPHEYFEYSVKQTEVTLAIKDYKIYEKF